MISLTGLQMVNRRQEYLEVFLDEIREMLSKWDSIVSGPGFPQSKDLLSELFRVTHSIKGASGTMGLNKLSTFVHHVEDLIEFARTYPQAVDPRFTDMIEHCRVILVSWVDTMQLEPEASEMLPDISDEIKKIIGKEFSDIVTTHQESNVSENSHQAQSLVENKDADVLSELNVSGVQIDNTPILSKKGKLNPVGKELPEKSKVQDPVSFIRIGMEKIDHLFRIVGELSIQNEILYHAWESGKLNSELASSSVNLINKGMTELQDQAFSLRMQPVKPIFVSLQRAAFDVSRTLHKKIKVLIEGEEEEFDKSLLEFMKLPLTHIVRNAVDHGIEPLPVRRKLGKPDVSLLKMSAEPHSGGVIIKISDDGKGLSPDFIKKKALEKGFLNQEDEISDDRVLQLIFLPGFSTTDQVSEISGRGVGLDVVSGAIKDCGGTIKVTSEVEKGTCFEIMLPSTIAVMDALIVQIAGEKYAVAVAEISEIVNLAEYHLEKTSLESEVFSLRGTVVPIEKLRDFLPGKGPDMSSTVSGSRGKMQGARIAVICSGNKELPIAFEVDLILGHQPIVARPLDDKIKHAPGISGGTILSDGMPGLILNLSWINEKICEQRKESGERIS